MTSNRPNHIEPSSTDPTGSDTKRPVLWRLPAWSNRTRRLRRWELLTENGWSIPRSNPSVAGDIVVWREHPDRNNRVRSDIVFFDIRSQRRRCIKETLYRVQGPIVSGNLICWSDVRNGNPDVYSYNIDTQEESLMLTSPDAEYVVGLTKTALICQRFWRIDNGIEGNYLPDVELIWLNKLRN